MLHRLGLTRTILGPQRGAGRLVRERSRDDPAEKSNGHLKFSRQNSHARRNTCVRMSQLLAPAKLLFLTFRLLFVRSLFVSRPPAQVDARRSVTAGHGPVTSRRPVRAHRRPRPVTPLRVGSRQSRRPRLFEWARRSLTWPARLGSPRVVRPRGGPDPACFNSLACRASAARQSLATIGLSLAAPTAELLHRDLRFVQRTSLLVPTIACLLSYRRPLFVATTRSRQTLATIGRSLVPRTCSERRYSFRRSLVFFRIDVRSSSRPRGRGSEPKFPYRPKGHRCRADCATPCAAPGSFPGGSQAIGRL